MYGVGPHRHDSNLKTTPLGGSKGASKLDAVFAKLTKAGQRAERVRGWWHAEAA